MPCRDSYDDYNAQDLERAREQVRAELEPLLCEACSLLEEEAILETHASPELIKWYKDHEICEADRVRLEAAQKLSERERRLLGIDLNDLRTKALKKKKR